MSYSSPNYYEQTVRKMLDGINTHRHRDLAVAHGFEVDAVEAERRENLFSGEPETWVRADLRVPVIYTPGGVPARAELPASLRNLEQLERWIDHDTRRGVPRTFLREFRVSPSAAPDPLTLGRDANPHWTVAAEFEVV